MLVLSREIGERVRVGRDVIVTLVAIRGNKVRLGFDAPSSVQIDREEVYLKLAQAHSSAANPEKNTEDIGSACLSKRSDAE
jgi:carbon storage regulator